MNNEIPFNEMRVVVANPDGKDTMLGVLTKDEALREADERVGLNVHGSCMHRRCVDPLAIALHAWLIPGYLWTLSLPGIWMGSCQCDEDM
jgi:hypothetical protein